MGRSTRHLGPWSNTEGDPSRLFAADPTKWYAAQYGVSEDAVTAFVASFTAAFKASDAAPGDQRR
jgi:hypothetical protein